MAFGNREILFASLVGSRVMEQVPRFSAVQNELMKHVLPVRPFLPFGDVDGPNVAKVQGDVNARVWEADPRLGEDEQFFPFIFEGENGERFMLPYEPFVSISGKNNIVRRNVAKMQTQNGRVLGGSIKERWSQGDYEITITGALYGSIMTGSVEDCFPRADFEKLRDYMTVPKSLKVYCEPLQLLGINQLVIEDFSFPFSKGENVQAYEIKAYSDFPYKLLLDIND